MLLVRKSNLNLITLTFVGRFQWATHWCHRLIVTQLLTYCQPQSDGKCDESPMPFPPLAIRQLSKFRFFFGFDGASLSPLWLASNVKFSKPARGRGTHVTTIVFRHRPGPGEALSRLLLDFRYECRRARTGKENPGRCLLSDTVFEGWQ